MGRGGGKMFRQEHHTRRQVQGQGDGYADLALGRDDLGGVAFRQTEAGGVFRINLQPGARGDRQGAAGMVGGVGAGVLQGFAHHQGEGPPARAG